MKHKSFLLISIAFVIVFAFGGCRSVQRSASRRLTRTQARAVERQSVRSVDRNATRATVRDFKRDSASPAKRLSRELTTFRYATRAEAKRELRSGIRPRTHFTSSARPGRPLSARAAQARYGLPRTPEVRMTVGFPKGSPVKRNRVIGGARGVGELTTAKRTDSRVIRKVVPLK